MRYLTLGEVGVAHRSGRDHTNGHACDYKVQVSNNHSTWTTVYTKVNGVGGIGGVECIPLPGVSGRYVRLEMSRRNTLDHQIEEIEVCGR